MKYNEIYHNTKNSANQLADYTVSRAKSEFGVLEFGIFKLCMASIGLLIGSFFSEKVKKFAPILVLITICSWIFLMYKLFIKD